MTSKFELATKNVIDLLERIDNFLLEFGNKIL